MTGALRLAAILLILPAIATITPGSRAQSVNGFARIEIIEVKNVGLSAINEAKSIIQVRWEGRYPQGTSVKSFDVSLEVQYADNTKERAKTTVSGSTSSTRFEVPTLHLSPGRPGAEMRSFDATVTANFTETATKQGNL